MGRREKREVRRRSKRGREKGERTEIRAIFS